MSKTTTTTVTTQPISGQEKAESKPEQKAIGDYSSVTEFLHGFKSKHTVRGCKTALDKFFGYAVFEKDFNSDATIKMKLELILSVVIKYVIHLKTLAKTTGEFKRGEVSVNRVGYYTNVQN